MIDISKAKKEFKKFLKKYKNEDKLGYNLKVKHTFHVMENSKIIAESLNLSKEDILLAQLIALLHDIGRFEELEMFNKFESAKFDHANHGVKILFEDKLIERFLSDEEYYDVIKKSISNHNKLDIEKGLNAEELIHSKIIRDADKLDNYRVKREERIEEIFPGKVSSKDEMELSTISDKVYNSIIKRQCVNIHDRKTPLDYWLCVLAFVFDINFIETYRIIKKKKYIDVMLDRFKYKDQKTKTRIEEIRKVTNDYINSKLI